MTNYRDQQFKVVFKNNLSDFELAFDLYIDGERIYRKYLPAGLRGEILGIRNTTFSKLPFKFQEVQLVGTFPEHSLR